MRQLFVPMGNDENGRLHCPLHRDPAEGVCDRADQDDGGEDRAEVANHEGKDLLPLERCAVCGDLLFDLLDTDHSRNEQAGGDRGDRHHDGVREEIEEIQELHANDGDLCEWTVAEGGQAAEGYDDEADDGR